MEPLVKLFGTPKIILGQEAQALPNDKRGALLAYLAFQKDWVSREQLAFLFWPDSDQGTALANLRQLLRRSKQITYATNLDIEPEQVRWQVSTDVANFQKHCQDQDWLKSIECYQDHFLNTFRSDSPGFETWLELERSNLKLNWQEAAFMVTENLSKTDRASEAASLLLQLWRLSDYDESFLQSYLKQAYAAGQKTVALSAYATFREQLLKTFELDVSNETHELIQAIKSDTLKTASTSHSPKKPKRLSQPLLGRQKELSELTEFLKHPECRALCLTGPGGIGKTRLAQEVAQRLLADYEHGVYFVPLAHISKGEEIINAIASALSFSFYGRTEPKVQLTNYLRNKTMLLLVDNLEHVLEGTSLLAELLAEAPELTLLITSRQLPELAEVWPFALQGLAYEQPESDAEKLFIQLATKQQPRFHASESALESIRQICTLVEGMPLAIELAASWVRELSPKEILEQLGRSFEMLKRDGQRQHDSMQAVFDYSWQLLSPEQQNLLAQLSVFRGGFTSAAAEAVAGATPYLLLSLQNRSLISKDEAGRYGLHELVRQYAAEKLRLVDEAGVYDRHANYFADVLAVLGEHYYSGQRSEVTNEVDQENANIRQTWNWSVERHLWTNITKSLNIFAGFLIARGLNLEGKLLFETLLENLDTEVLLKARTQAHLGAFCRLLGDIERAQHLLEESLPILEQHQHVESLFFVYQTLGILWVNCGDYNQAESWFQKEYALGKKEQHKPTLATTLCSLGNVYTDQGKYSEAIGYYQRGLELAEEIRDRQAIAYLTFNLGYALWESGDKTAGEEATLKARQLAQEIENQPLYSGCLSNLAEMAFIQGDYETASSLRQQSLALARQMGNRREEAADVVLLGYNALRLGQMEEAKQHFLEGLKLAHAISLNPTLLDVLIGLAELDILAQRSEAGLANLIFASEHSATSGEAKKRAKELLQKVETQVSPSVLETAHQQAQSLNLEQVVKELLNYTKLTAR